MLKSLRYLILGAIALALLTMALANRAPVELQFLPDGLSAFLGVDFRITLPLFLILFLAMVVGLLIGFVWEWLREHKHRAAARTHGRAVTKLERELAEVKQATGTPKDDILALLDRPKSGAKAP
jgi:putative membrane protein